MVFVEAQMKWSENLCFRLSAYYFSVLQRHVKEKELDLYQTKAVKGISKN